MMPLIKRLLIPIASVLAVCALAAPAAFASTNQITIVQDNNALAKNPAGFLKTLQGLGVKEVKYAVYWAQYALNANARSVPAADTTPQAYLNHRQFGLIDEIDQNAAADGITVRLMITAPAPRWAEGATSGCSANNISPSGNGDCRPSTADYENFIKALGERYDGSQTGFNGQPLPKITAWSIWNEPNFSPNIAPQVAGPNVYEAADIYRGLVDAAWAGLKATGHSRDSFLIGELAPRGIAGPSNANESGTKPVQFLAALYCESTSGRRMSASMARANGCAGSPAGFRSAHPALFDASGVADHPYSQGAPANVPTYDCRSYYSVCQNSRTRQGDPEWTDLGQISHLTTALDRDLHADGSSRHYPIWNTEYGYWETPSHSACHSPFEADCAVSPAQAAVLLNEAEYVSYENPRLVSFDQYQMYQPTTGVWTDGLLSPRGVPEASFSAWRVPLFMPNTSLSHPGMLLVWGGARPANTDTSKTIAVQFKGRSGGWKTIATARLSQDAYFTARVRFSASGLVRLAYSTGSGTLTSRTQAITVR